MRTLPNRIISAKNRIDNPNPWLVLLNVVIPLTPEPLNLYIVNNNEDISFGTPPQVYTAVPFSIALPAQSSTGELQTTQLKLEDVGGAVRQYIKLLNGGFGTTVRLRVINAEYLDNAGYAHDSYSNAADYAELDVEFDLLDVSGDKDGVLSFSLGAPNMMRQLFPPGRYLANNCMWAARYGSFECKLSAMKRAIYPTCDGTVENCRIRGNTANYGGHPGLAVTSLRIA